MIFCACLLSSSRITINITQSNDLVEKLDNQRNANQNHYEVPFHTSQNGCNPKVYKQ